jgi:hypothetical protein
MNRLRPTCMKTKAAAKDSPRSPKAVGMEADRTRPAAISSSNMVRTGPRSGSSQLVIHDV